MKTRLAVPVFLGLCVSGVAQAALYDRGGGLIYDSVLDVTWLQDANYAATELSDARVDEPLETATNVEPTWV